MKPLLSTKSKEHLDLSFSSSSEIESFVRAKIGQPSLPGSKAEGNSLARPAFEGTFVDLKGVDTVQALTPRR